MAAITNKDTGKEKRTWSQFAGKVAHFFSQFDGIKATMFGVLCIAGLVIAPLGLAAGSLSVGAALGLVAAPALGYITNKYGQKLWELASDFLQGKSQAPDSSAAAGASSAKKPDGPGAAPSSTLNVAGVNRSGVANSFAQVSDPAREQTAPAQKPQAVPAPAPAATV